jgi:hypothetical protein
MLEHIRGLPGNILGIVATGEETGTVCETVLTHGCH